MRESYFIAPFGGGNFKYSLPAQTRAKKAGVLFVEVRMSRNANIRFLHYISVIVFPEMFSQRVIGHVRRVKTHVNIYRDKRKFRNENHR
ncbi:MAG: hypothetical protein BWY90_01283 [Deltaproteobacteria bacterium ADurb.BinA014]|nr:MAG: hypothetical protein BWY90_01283 [Deltaproteobacteria bacterium ADurb.BinA014]